MGHDGIGCMGEGEAVSQWGERARRTPSPNPEGQAGSAESTSEPTIGRAGGWHEPVRETGSLGGRCHWCSHGSR